MRSCAALVLFGARPMEFVFQDPLPIDFSLGGPPPPPLCNSGIRFRVVGDLGLGFPY